ncbi:hypothetical protein JOC36_000226 [Weissella uvarum]|uniref:hypothetical protein n=1 Tax=Weissella uvarum TaxID=1479233 RepID=UPI00196039B2|nr:hypothetical protein [Weissella uvarum]MBM7616693.1 hypothetical protein [Weissella uvarum]MCM0594852.1 hypothetical protein [Weissella uvarum]
MNVNPTHDPQKLKELVDTVIEVGDDRFGLAVMANCYVIENADISDEAKVKSFKLLLKQLDTLY